MYCRHCTHRRFAGVSDRVQDRFKSHMDRDSRILLPLIENWQQQGRVLMHLNKFLINRLPVLR
ncbi:MAG: hypothetical protein VR69_07040 [Peptococcaceae bacterium BRH_c4b]|nr:MAG: hypothetical protein VR69_07040 [Peptococcaceae bacterium BRH_c4b]